MASHESDHLPTKARAWFAVKIGLTGLVALCTAQWAETYEILHDLCAQVGQNDWLTSTNTDDQKKLVATVLIPLTLLIILVSLWQERSATRDAVRTERDSLYFIDELRKGIGPKLKEAAGAQDRDLQNEKLADYRHILLAAAYKRWGGGDIRLGYYNVRRNADRKYSLSVVNMYPLETAPQAKVLPADTLLAEPWKDVKSHWPWRPRAPEYGDCLKSLLIIPVYSPLETRAPTTGVILVDSHEARRFEGKPNEISAQVLAALMAVGDTISTGLFPRARVRR